MDTNCVWEDIQNQDDPCIQQQTQAALPKCAENSKAQVCERLKQYHELSTILQSVLNIAATITQIMEFVGIHQCKCQKAMDIIIYAFLHFDEFTDRPCGHSRKQIRKDEFLCDLRHDCCFTKQEAKITYAITKYAFQSFYYKQIITKFDDSFIDNCAWLVAAKKTIKAYKQLDGVEPEQISKFSTNVHCAYKDYLERRRMNIEKFRSKYECRCTKNSSGKNNWLNELCDTGRQPCSAKKPGYEFTIKDCTCICDDTIQVTRSGQKIGDRGASGVGGAGGAGSADGDRDNISRSGNANDTKSKTGNDTGRSGEKYEKGDPSSAKNDSKSDCEEQLRAIKNQLLNMEKEKADWEAEKLKIQEEAKERDATYNDLLEKLAAEQDPLNKIGYKPPCEEFSIYLKFYQSGKNCMIDLTGIELPGEFITHVTNLKITNDTNEAPLHFHCIRTTDEII